MNLLFISHEGDSLGLSIRCKEEGHHSTLFTIGEGCKSVGDGLVTIPQFSKLVMKRSGECIGCNVDELLNEYKPDLVVFDTIGYGKVAEYIKGKGVPVFGSSVWSDLTCKDDDYLLSLFSSKLIDKHDTSDVVDVVMVWNGIETTHSCLVVNESRFMVGGLGVDVGSAGYSIISNHIPPIFEEIVGRIEDVMKKVRFRGILNIKCSPTGKIRRLNFNLPFIAGLLELYKGSVVDFLHSTSIGTKFKGQITTDYSSSILLSVPPFPYQIDARNYSILGVSPLNLKHFYPIDVCKPLSVYETATAHGRVGWVTARGRSIREARKRAYRTISNLRIDDVQYRVDVGEGVREV